MVGLVGSFEETKEMIQMLRDGKAETRVVPHHFDSIMNANQGFRDLKAGKIIGRRIFKHDWPEAKV